MIWLMVTPGTQRCFLVSSKTTIFRHPQKIWTVVSSNLNVGLTEDFGEQNFNKLLALQDMFLKHHMWEGVKTNDCHHNFHGSNIAEKLPAGRQTVGFQAQLCNF